MVSVRRGLVSQLELNVSCQMARRQNVMYSHEELISAVRAAGRDGKTFTVKDVRNHLGFKTQDKKEISRFRRRLRAFEKVASEQLEKVGNNSYRLRPGAFEQGAALDITQLPAAELDIDLEPASGVFEAPPANQATKLEAFDTAVQAAEAAAFQPDVQPLAAQPAAVFQADVQPAAAQPTPAIDFQAVEQPAAARPTPAIDIQAAQPAAAVPPATEHRASVPRRAWGAASALVSGAFAASAAVSSRVRERSRELRERSHNLREKLLGCLSAVPLNRHAVARLRGWAEGLRPLSNEVREHLQALRQRVTSIRRRAA